MTQRISHTGPIHLAPTEGFLSKEELRAALNLPSTRMVDEMMRKRRIPYIKLGHRTVRFSLSKVMTALGRLEVNAVGRA